MNALLLCTDLLDTFCLALDEIESKGGGRHECAVGNGLKLQ